jgi:hypothetical protein
MKDEFLFSKSNYKILLIGIAIVALGFILMVGGGNDNPNEFSEDIFSFRRIHLSPALILLGLGVCFYSIFKKDKKAQ